jgi:hypothetical protein
VEEVDAATSIRSHKVDGRVWNQRGLSQEKIFHEQNPTSLWKKFLLVVVKKTLKLHPRDDFE